MRFAICDLSFLIVIPAQAGIQDREALLRRGYVTANAKTERF